MKFKISNIHLHVATKELVNSIGYVLGTLKTLIFIDLSWTNLLPSDLAQITFTLSKNAKALRNLNLSYNKLHFDYDTDYE